MWVLGRLLKVNERMRIEDRSAKDKRVSQYDIHDGVGKFLSNIYIFRYLVYT